MSADVPESRLLRVLGDDPHAAALNHALGETGARLIRNESVAIRGLNPVGVETARLLLRSAVREIVLLDEPRDAVVTDADIRATTSFRREDLGSSRVDALLRSLTRAHASNGRTSVRAAGARDARWTRERPHETRAESRAETAGLFPEPVPGVLISAWHADAPGVADERADWLSRQFTALGGTHIMAAAPGLFAFVRATPGAALDPKTKHARDSQSDARLARAPTSLLESVVPAGADPRHVLVTVCDANAHGLREGDRISFFHGREDDEASFPSYPGEKRKRRSDAAPAAADGVVVSVAGLHAFVAECDARVFDDRGVRSKRAFLREGAYVRQHPRVDAYAGDGFDRIQSFASDSDAQDASSRDLDLDSSNRSVSPRDVQGVSSFVFDSDAARIPPNIAAARVLTAFLALGRRPEAEAETEKVKETENESSTSNRAITALIRGARVSFPPCVSIAAAVAAHEALKVLARVQVPLGVGSSGRWFAHDFAELEPSIRAPPSEPVGNGPRAPAKAEATTVEDLVSFPSSTRDGDSASASGAFPSWKNGRYPRAALVGSGNAIREIADQLARIFGRRAEAEPKPIDTGGLSLDAYRHVRDIPRDCLEALDVLIMATEGFTERRGADAFSTRYGFSFLDAGLDNHAFSCYVAVKDVTAPWSRSGARDPSERSFPACAVGNFPHVFPHCAQWAREEMRAAFVDLPSGRDSTLETAGAAAGRRAVAREPRKETNTNDFREQCVSWARARFQYLFVETAREALRSNPYDAAAPAESVFWRGPKRPPTPIRYDVADEDHVAFVVAAAKLRARNVFGTANVVDTESSDDAYAYFATREDAATVSQNPSEIWKREAKYLEPLSRMEVSDDAPDARSRDPTRAAFLVAAATCRARVFDIPVPEARDLAALVTGARPETPAPAAYAAALIAAETYKLVLLKTDPARAAAAAGAAADGNTFRCSYGSLGRHAHCAASPLELEVKTAKRIATGSDATAAP